MATSYKEEMQTTADETKDTATNLKNKVSETATKARENVEEAGRNARNRIDESRQPAAEKLENAATALHEKADRLPGGETVAGLAHSAADKLQSTAEYVRDHNVQDMAQEVESFVRRYPGQSLLAAAAVGFLVGVSFKRSD